MNSKSNKRSANSTYEQLLEQFNVQEKLKEIEEKNTTFDNVKLIKKKKTDDFDLLLPEDEGIKYERVENPEDEVYDPTLDDYDEDEIENSDFLKNSDEDLLEEDVDEEDISSDMEENKKKSSKELHIQQGDIVDTNTDKQIDEHHDISDEETIATKNRVFEEINDLDNDNEEENKLLETTEMNIKDPFVREILRIKFGLKEQKQADLNKKEFKKFIFDSKTQSRYYNNNNNDNVEFKSDKNWIQNSYIKERLYKQLDPYKDSIEIEKIFSLCNNYSDLLYANMKDEERDTTRISIVLHILNHCLKSRDIEMRHTRRIQEKIQKERLLRREQETQRQLLREQGLLKKNKKNKNKKNKKNEDQDLENKDLSAMSESIPKNVNIDDIDNEDTNNYKDQGFTRPKVLIICPFRYNAYMFVHELLSLLPKDMHKENEKRFDSEYGEDEEENEQNTVAWKKAFPGNNDDCFRMGIAFKRKSLTLYSDFYNSDIIIGSPVGLKQIIGEEGDSQKQRNYDFLSSIEIVYIENADIIDYQNWSHLLNIYKWINKTLKQDHGCDYSRIKDYLLDGYGEYVRQTIITSRYLEPKMKSLLSVYSHNYRGQYEIRSKYEGTVMSVYNKNRQLFLRLDPKNLMDVNNTRFLYFKKTILPFLQKKENNGILLYVEEYYDYILIRNLMMEEILEDDVAVINEYLPSNECMRSSTYFKNRTVRMLLFSGRYHYFRRYPVEGVNSVFFIGLPREATFYNEIVNSMNYSPLTVSVTCLYTQYEGNELERIVGSDRYKLMIKGKRNSYIFC